MPDISQITLPDNNTYDIDAMKVNGYTVGGDIFIGYCNTSANTAIKVVTLISNNSSSFALKDGTILKVKFKYHNSASGNIWLSVNSISDTIRLYTNVIPGSTDNWSWYDGSVVTFVYFKSEGDSGAPYWYMENFKGGLKEWIGTQAQYDALTPDSNTTYYITDGYAPPTPNAGTIGYDNTGSGLSANTVQAAIDAIIDRIYPVGSIYMSVTDSTVEAVQAKFGGTWVRFAEGTTLISANTTYPINTTGGSSTHQHKYGYQYAGYYREVLMEQVADAGVLNYSDATNYTIAAQTTTIPASSATALAVNSSTTGAISSTDKQANRYASIGNTGTSSTLPPYTTVYMYKRTA